MAGLVVAIHLIACLGLIVIVLVQRGRGGGLVESFSGLESMFGVKTSVFLTRTTTVFSVIFFITCLLLTFFSVRQSRSLLSGKIPAPVTGTTPLAEQEKGAVGPQAVPAAQPPVTQPVAAEAPKLSKESEFMKETPAAPLKKTDPVKGLVPVQEVTPQDLQGSAVEENKEQPKAK
ncbi:MAG: preprotein translocase subunit SecG [Candidatus Omnitrophota bacterium]|jgi:preprotein translocase subunit SecG